MSEERSFPGRGVGKYMKVKFQAPSFKDLLCRCMNPVEAAHVPVIGEEGRGEEVKS